MSAARRPPPRILELKSNSHSVCGPSRLIEACLGNVDTTRVTPVLGLIAAPGLEAPVHFTSPFTEHLEHHVLPWRGHRHPSVMADDLRRLIAGHRIAGVHSHDMRSDWLCAIAGGRPGLGVPWVPHLHGWLGAQASPAMRLRELLHAFALRRADEVWVVAETARAAARRYLHPETPVRVVRNAIDPRVLAGATELSATLRASLRLPAGALLVGTSARLERFKGHRRLAEAAIAAGIPELHVVLLGYGPEESALRALAARPPFAGRVSVPGAMPPSHVLAMVAALDIFALASLRETLSLAVLEAMHLGRPVVASDVGDLRWALDGGAAGMLVRPGDAGDLADALRRLARNPGMRDRLGAAARTRAVSSFSPARLAREVEDGWLALLGDAPP
jgi:glycosyltransferase involved in cell wall biosynthesis